MALTDIQDEENRKKILRLGNLVPTLGVQVCNEALVFKRGSFGEVLEHLILNAMGS